MPAMVPARSPVHIFSTPRASTGRSWTVAAMVARCRAELPPAHELSTLTMAASLSPALRSQVCPRTQPWSLSRPAMALPRMTRPSSSGREPGVAEGLVHHLVGHGLEGQIATAHVGHAGADDGDVGRCSCALPPPGPGCRADEGGAQQAEVLHRRRTGHHHDDVPCPGIGIAPEARRHRTRVIRPPGGAGRPWPAARRAGRASRAPRAGASASSPTRTKTTTPGLDGLGVRPAAAVSFRSVSSAGAYSSGGEEQGDPAVAHGGGPAAGRRARAAEPQRDGGRGRVLDVARRRRRAAGPGLRAGRPRRRPSAGPAGGSRPRPARTRSAWLPTPRPSTKRPPERCWSAVACLATAAGRRRGSWRTQVPNVGRRWRRPPRPGSSGPRRWGGARRGGRPPRASRPPSPRPSVARRGPARCPAVVVPVVLPSVDGVLPAWWRGG